MQQLQNACSLVHPGLDFFFRKLGNFQAIGHVVIHAHVRVQRVVLENHGDISLGWFQLIDYAFTNGHSTCSDGLQARHHAQQRGFAAARWPDDDDKLAIVNLSTQILNDGIALGAYAIGFLEVR